MNFIVTYAYKLKVIIIFLVPLLDKLYGSLWYYNDFGIKIEKILKIIINKRNTVSR